MRLFKVCIFFLLAALSSGSLASELFNKLVGKWKCTEIETEIAEGVLHKSLYTVVYTKDSMNVEQQGESIIFLKAQSKTNAILGYQNTSSVTFEGDVMISTPLSIEAHVVTDAFGFYTPEVVKGFEMQRETSRSVIKFLSNNKRVSTNSNGGKTECQRM